MKFYDQTPIGRLTNRFSKDVFSVDSDVPGHGVTFIDSALLVLGLLGGVLFQLPYMILGKAI